MNEISLMAIVYEGEKQIVSCRIVRGCHFISISSLSVFVTSKSYIYITPNEVAKQISDCDHAAESPSIEPIYENIENGNIVPSDDNKFTIYVNYDFINGGKSKSSKSSVRLLEPDVRFTQNNHEIVDECDDERAKSGDHGDHDDNEVENNSKTMSKMIQCQQISMYIGEKKRASMSTNFSFIIY